MAKHTISASALIPATARQIYDLIADYRNGHPRILPKLLPQQRLYPMALAAKFRAG